MYDAKRMNEVLIPSSGKMVLLDKLLPKLKREGHKVLFYNLTSSVTTLTLPTGQDSTALCPKRALKP
jgi:molybdopterin-guanine dinucleotide biosynthesis protein